MERSHKAAPGVLKCVDSGDTPGAAEGRHTATLPAQQRGHTVTLLAQLALVTLPTQQWEDTQRHFWRSREEHSNTFGTARSGDTPGAAEGTHMAPNYGCAAGAWHVWGARTALNLRERRLCLCLRASY